MRKGKQAGRQEGRKGSRMEGKGQEENGNQPCMGAINGRYRAKNREEKLLGRDCGRRTGYDTDNGTKLGSGLPSNTQEQSGLLKRSMRRKKQMRKTAAPRVSGCRQGF